MKLNPDEVKPKKRGISDKYSWNLYRYLRDHNRFDIRFCFYEKSFLDGSEVLFNTYQSVNVMQFYVLLGKGFSGQRLHGIMAAGDHSRIDTFSFSDWERDKFIDVTEWFWNQYKKIGRCVFDLNHTGHWAGGSGRYTRINRNARRCNWCGQHQRRTIKKLVKIERREVWQ